MIILSILTCLLGQVVKFCEDGSSSHEINAVDRGILELSKAVKRLQGQVEELQSKIDQLSHLFFLSNSIYSLYLDTHTRRALRFAKSASLWR